MAEGVDWVATGPSPAELVAAGKSFAMRYIARSDYPPLSVAEAAGLHAEGLDVGIIGEWGSQRMLGGRTAGVIDGQKAAAALASLGAPAGVVVYACADWDVQPAQLPSVDSYLAGFASVVGQPCTGLYGGLRVIEHVQGTRTASHFWQCYAWSGVRTTVWAPNTHLQQYRNGETIAGHSVDLDRSMQADWGQWRASDMGVRVKQAATVSTTSPWASFGTAKTAKACKGNDTGTGAQHDFPAGADLGVVQLGSLVAALGSWPAGTPIVLTNVNGEQAAFIKAEVVFTPIAPPVPPAAPTKTVTVSGQNLKVAGPQ